MFEVSNFVAVKYTCMHTSFTDDGLSFLTTARYNNA